MLCGLLVATPQILPPPRRVRIADTASFMEKPFIEVGLLAAPGKHRFKFGEVVTVAVGVWARPGALGRWGQVKIPRGLAARRGRRPQPGLTTAASTHTAATSHQSNSGLLITLNAGDQPPAEIPYQKGLRTSRGGSCCHVQRVGASHTLPGQ